MTTPADAPDAAAGSGPVTGIVVALSFEAGAISAHANACAIAVAGVGAQRAAAAAAVLLDAGAAGIASVGTAGALAAGPEPGALILPHAVMTADEVLPVNRDWRARIAAAVHTSLAVHDGPLLQTAAVVTTVADKRELFRTTGAVAADMESHAVASVARKRNVPFVAVRVILDAAGTPVPPTVLAALSDDGRLQPAALGRALLSTPGDVFMLWRLGRNFKKARATLRQLMQATGPGLCLTDAPAAA